LVFSRLVDVDGDTETLDKGTQLLVVEVLWRRKGRPVSELEGLIEKADSVVDQESLRSVTFGIAEMRHLDEEISERMEWAREHPPCATPGCVSKVRRWR
jgi:hypothetical protein